jgi:hypothetical protein
MPVVYGEGRTNAVRQHAKKILHTLSWAFSRSRCMLCVERERTNTVRRLRQEINDASKDKECLRQLYVTDPRADKIRIKETKGGLIQDSYH